LFVKKATSAASTASSLFVGQVAWWRATATPEPIPKIGCKNASPARREFNDGRAFAGRDQTLERTASDVGDFGGFIIGVDDEPVFFRPPCALTSCASSQAG
jgi:hypothetical protein